MEGWIDALETESSLRRDCGARSRRGCSSGSLEPSRINRELKAQPRTEQLNEQRGARNAQNASVFGLLPDSTMD